MKLYTTAEIADFLSLCERSIGNLRKKKIIPYLRVGKIIRFQPEKVLEALNKFEIPAKVK
jgi:hypothetical protein